MRSCIAGIETTLFLVSIVGSLGSSFAQANDAIKHEHVFLRQKAAPLTAISESDSGIVLKNVSKKQVVGYTLACFGRVEKNTPIAIFSPSKVPISPGTTLFQGGFDAYPVPHACSVRKSLVGVAQVTFVGGTTWTSPLMRNSPADLERIELPED